MGVNDPRPLAPHVKAALGRGAAPALQPKAGARPQLAPHVAAATGVAQARPAGSPPSGAAHVQAAVAAARGGAVSPAAQLKPQAGPSAGAPKPAPHVQAAVAAHLPPKTAQMKPAAPPPQHPGVIQRVICILEDHLGDFSLWHQVYNMLKKHPEEDVQILEHVKGKVKPGERLAIVGHGNTKVIGKWYNPNILANTLGRLDLPKDLKRIELLTCESGTGDERSYAAGLSQQLGRRYEVRGYRGYNFTTSEGKNRAELPSQSLSVIEKLDFYWRDTYKEKTLDLNQMGIFEPGLAPILKLAGLTEKDLEGFKEVESASELILERLEKLFSGSEESSSKKEEDLFLVKFQEVVENLKKDPPESLKPILIKMVEDRFGSTPSSGASAHKVNPQGRVTFKQETGEMIIKTHKEFLNL
jgi:hypothetical protein